MLIYFGTKAVKWAWPMRLDRDTLKDSHQGATSFYNMTSHFGESKWTKSIWIPQNRWIHKISWMLPIPELNDWREEIIGKVILLLWLLGCFFKKIYINWKRIGRCIASMKLGGRGEQTEWAIACPKENGQCGFSNFTKW